MTRITGSARWSHIGDRTRAGVSHRVGVDLWHRLWGLILNPVMRTQSGVIDHIYCR